MKQQELIFTKRIRAANYPALSARNTMYARIIDFLGSVIDGTNKEIAQHLGTDACSVTGRVMELRERNVVEFSRQRECLVTKRNVSAWRLANA